MSEEILASEQFARDIRLVLDNDYESYKRITSAAKRLNHTYELAEYIRDMVESSIMQSINENSSKVGELLVRQLCTGWGIDPYMRIAAEIKAELSESAGV